MSTGVGCIELSYMLWDWGGGAIVARPLSRRLLLLRLQSGDGGQLAVVLLLVSRVELLAGGEGEGGGDEQGTNGAFQPGHGAGLPSLPVLDDAVDNVLRRQTAAAVHTGHEPLVHGHLVRVGAVRLRKGGKVGRRGG